MKSLPPGTVDLLKVTTERVTSENAARILERVKRAEGAGGPGNNYKVRRLILQRSGGEITTTEAYTRPMARNLEAPARRALLKRPAQWLSERQGVHDRMIAAEVAKAEALGKRLNEPGTVYALRGNTASGKTTTVKSHPSLGPRALDGEGNMTGTINPDPIKAQLAEREGGAVTNDQVHEEGSVLADKVEEKLLQKPDSTLVYDKRFAAAGDVPKLLDKIGGRKLKLIDIDVPLETSAVRVLMREPGGADPLVGWKTVADGFEGVRGGRKALLEGDGKSFRGVMGDARVSDYELYVTNAEGKSVLVARKTAGAWQGPATPEAQALFVEAVDKENVLGAISRARATVIDDAFIEQTVSKIKDPAFQGKMRARLSEYKGMTLQAALDAHAKKTPPATTAAAPPPRQPAGLRVPVPLLPRGDQDRRPVPPR